MRLAARCDELGIVDLQQRLLESDELVRLSVKQPAERRQLNGFLLQRAVGEEKRHGEKMRLVARPVLSKVRGDGELFGFPAVKSPPERCAVPDGVPDVQPRASLDQQADDIS